MGRQSYGIKRVAVPDDGAWHEGVHVAWATAVVAAEGYEDIPVDVARIVAVRPDAPEGEVEDDAP